MKLRVLGCHGGELPGCRSTCFLVDGSLALDAGALTASLDLRRAGRVDHIVLTHSHFDHVKDLPLLSDLVVGWRKTPISIWASHACVPDAARENMFNGVALAGLHRIPLRGAAGVPAAELHARGRRSRPVHTPCARCW